MKKMDTYGLRLCKYQAELFEKSIDKTKCGSKIFIRRFMHSDYAKRMDMAGFLYGSEDVDNAFIDIELEYGASDYGKEKMDREAIYWTGYIYRYWTYISGKSSKQIYKMVKPDELSKLYYPYHSLDPEAVIERIREAKGIVDETDISRGVEVMRRVRARRANDKQFKRDV